MTKNPDALHVDTEHVLLLAEDDPDQSDMLRETLEDEGYRVETAFSGDTALKKLTSHTYDLVIMDIRMPGLDGVTVLKKYRNDIHSKTPVVVVSAFATETDIRQYKAAGANAALAKPYAIDELLQMVRGLIGEKESSK